MTKVAQAPVLAGREGGKLGPGAYHMAVPRIAAQPLTPRHRGGEQGGGGGALTATGYTEPRDRASVASHHSHGYRKPDKERKWQLRGWQLDEPPDKPEDGIVGWAKRRATLENKKGTKRSPSITENEHYFPVKSHCLATEDFEAFRQESLHSRFLPKVKPPCQATRGVAVTLRYSKSEDKVQDGVPGQRAGAGAGGGVDAECDPVQREMLSYRTAKQVAAALGQEIMLRRSKSLTDINMHYNSEQHNKIKRWLKFSKDRKLCKFDEDDDEGYSSKTSSAETKPRSDSDGELEGHLGLLKHSRLSSSMVDLSELPSNFTRPHRDTDRARRDDTAGKAGHGQEGEAGKVKFSYTHQPTILQIPQPDLKLIREHGRAERAATSEEVPFSYSRLKRAKEINKCYKIDPKKFTSENTVYDLSAAGRGRAESPRGMTLVLRKISIQNAEQQITSVMNGSPPPPVRPDSRPGSQPGTPMSRPASSASRAGSTKSRSGSAKSRANSANSRCSLTPQMEFKNRMQTKHVHQNTTRDSNPEHLSKSLKEPTWSQEYSVMGRTAATSYSIGDLLPAVDKSIYTGGQGVKGRTGRSHQGGKKYHGIAPLLPHHGKAPPQEEMAATSKDDGYLLLQKGMDILTGDREMRTLGPPPFRPSPVHQFVRNVKVAWRHGDAPRSSPIHGKGSYSPMGFHSDRGPRIMQSPEKETQRKLKEAFSKFYQNRPKEIGKEFRRMQTMWNA